MTEKFHVCQVKNTSKEVWHRAEHFKNDIVLLRTKNKLQVIKQSQIKQWRKEIQNHNREKDPCEELIVTKGIR